ncbi:MAG: mercury methylation ferredoxin HgcB [Desulforhabdus sp.]|jgi:Pyruvate/2-oxoacid:ferredoxin oxidoreductase delta subunit|nr:mercury methylation ferredoxin HgcB [Desulforhabdus sp.]
MRRLLYLKDVTTLQLDQSKCIGCGMCTVVCPHAVLSMNGKRAHIVERDACMECGACAQNCPAEAIQVAAGVGCAAAVINSMLGRDSSSCCCVIEPKAGAAASTICNESKKIECC